jgi:hypothetical protein
VLPFTSSRTSAGNAAVCSTAHSPGMLHYLHGMLAWLACFSRYPWLHSLHPALLVVLPAFRFRVLLHSWLYVQHEKFQSAPGSRVGTPAYLAPEVILTTRGKTYDGKVRHKANSSVSSSAAAAM